MTIDYDATNDDLAKAIRNMAIEECARAIEDKFLIDDPNFIKSIAAAIRALKEKE